MRVAKEIPPISEEAIERGFDKIEAFHLVQDGGTLEQLLEAIVLFQASLGVEEETRTKLYDRISESPLLMEPESSAYFLVGVMTGLSIAEYAEEEKAKESEKDSEDSNQEGSGA